MKERGARPPINICVSEGGTNDGTICFNEDLQTPLQLSHSAVGFTFFLPLALGLFIFLFHLLHKKAKNVTLHCFFLYFLQNQRTLLLYQHICQNLIKFSLEAILQHIIT